VQDRALPGLETSSSTFGAKSGNDLPGKINLTSGRTDPAHTVAPFGQD
jgi:hypothetical protein